jgi:sugar transferase EpsL
MNHRWAGFDTCLKRVLDVVLSATLLIVLSPLLFVISLALAVDNGRPVVFAQIRPGHKGKPFRICKFRTMKDLRDEQGNLLPDELRLTSLGRFLRSTSLDELPELLNVLKGDMSLVGPRPLLMEYLPLYSPRQLRRYEVKPGITGLAQVSGRNLLTWEEKFDLDVYYVDNWSLWLDFKILLVTVWKVVRREGINQVGHATMPTFTGSKDVTGL